MSAPRVTRSDMVFTSCFPATLRWLPSDTSIVFANVGSVVVVPFESKYCVVKLETFSRIFSSYAWHGVLFNVLVSGHELRCQGALQTVLPSGVALVFQLYIRVRRHRVFVPAPSLKVK